MHVEQRSCLVQVLCVEAFGEPAVDRSQQFPCLGPPYPLFAPESRQTAETGPVWRWVFDCTRKFSLAPRKPPNCAGRAARQPRELDPQDHARPEIAVSGPRGRGADSHRAGAGRLLPTATSSSQPSAGYGIHTAYPAIACHFGPGRTPRYGQTRSPA